MHNVFEKIFNTGIIPVVVLDNENDAEGIAQALCDGGIPAAEVTFRTKAAKNSIKIMKEKFGSKMLVGAGTVLTPEQVDDAIDAGASFIVSPGLNPKTVEYCLKKNIPVIPGTSSPSDIECALSLGLDTVKFFPAEASGGLAKIKAMSAPYGNIKFMPTGGIDEKNMLSYLSCDNIIACGGSFMVKKEWVLNKQYDKITESCKNAVKLMHGFKIAHVGINAENKDKANDIISMFSAFGFGVETLSASSFLDSSIEIMHSSGRGANGHIAIETVNIDRAVRYLSSKGIRFVEDSAKYDEKGNCRFIYLDGDFAGFAVHLIKKKK